VQTTYAFIPNLTSQSSTWMVRYAEHVHGSNGTNGTNGPARVAREGAVRIPGITPPRVVKKVDPCYPANPLAERVNGTVILYGVIRLDGMVEDVILVEGFNPRIDQASTPASTRKQSAPSPNPFSSPPARETGLSLSKFCLKSPLIWPPASSL
jgi:hypothetical protein